MRFITTERTLKYVVGDKEVGVLISVGDNLLKVSGVDQKIPISDINNSFEIGNGVKQITGISSSSVYETCTFKSECGTYHGMLSGATMNSAGNDKSKSVNLTIHKVGEKGEIVATASKVLKESIVNYNSVFKAVENFIRQNNF